MVVVMVPWKPDILSLTNEREMKRRNVIEPLGAHIRSFERADLIRSLFEVSESDFDLETASH